MKKLIFLAAVVVAVTADSADARAAFQPFTRPPQAALRLTRVLNAQLVTKATRCRVTNPYRIDCTSRYQKFPVRAVFHKINPFMLLADTYILGQHDVASFDTKVAY